MNVLVTGANGFIAQALLPELLKKGHRVRAAYRSTDKFPADRAGLDCVAVGAIGPETDWKPALQGVEAVIHLAGRAHVMEETAPDPLAEYRKVNVAGTRRLTESAAGCGVRRFLFLSTVKVNGEQTWNRPFSATDDPMPQDPYAISKWEAEQVLERVAARWGLGIVALRIPLVYGPGVKGNFLKMLEHVRQKTLMPLASVRNLRSLLYVGNLADALLVCLEHPGVAHKTFLISDGQDVSTPDLIRSLARSMGCPCRLMPFPGWALRAAGGVGDVLTTVTHKKFPVNTEFVTRLLNSLTVDAAPFRETTGWNPPVPVPEGLKRTAEWYRHHCSG